MYRSQLRWWLGAFLAVGAVAAAVGWRLWEVQQVQIPSQPISPSEQLQAEAQILDPYPAPAFTLRDHNDEPYRFTPDQGAAATMLFFGYTFCPDVCPVTLVEYRDVIKELGPDAARARFLFISVDPERDTPQRLKEHLGKFHPSIIGLTGNPAEVEAVVKDYGVVAKKRVVSNSAAGYLIDHTASILLIDGKGQVRVRFPFGMDARETARHVRQILSEGPTARDSVEKRG